MATSLEREISRRKRHRRIRKKIGGTPERPRLAVHRSLKNLYAQVIDDIAGHTLYSFSTLNKEFSEGASKKGKVQLAQKLGAFFAQRLQEKGIRKITMDRGGYQYHGRIKALAEALREAGIDF